MDDPIVAAVRKWVSDQGYPLEYRTAHVVRAAGFQVEQSVTYLDSSQTVREIDVRATLQQSGPKSLLRANLVIECKRNTQTWMVLMANTRRVAASLPFGSSFSNAGWAPRMFSNVFRLPELHGIAAVAVHAGRNADSPHEAISQAVSGALATVQVVGRSGYEEDPVRDFTFALPVVVLGGDLVSYYVDPSGGEHIDRMDHIRLAWSRYPGRERTTIVVDLVTEFGLPSYLPSVRDEFDQAGDGVDDGFRSEANSGSG